MAISLTIAFRGRGERRFFARFAWAWKRRLGSF